jgi:hypothetical protein
LKRSENPRIEQACGAGKALKETKESATGPGDGLSTTIQYRPSEKPHNSESRKRFAMNAVPVSAKETAY